MIDRYICEDINVYWTDEFKYSTWLTIEKTATIARLANDRSVKSDFISSLSEKYSAYVTLDSEDVKEIKFIEKTTKHDVIAFLSYMEQLYGDDARHMHVGLTSSDLVDTTFAVQLRNSGIQIKEKLLELCGTLRIMAYKYKNTPMIGRSHGMHAEPITFGFKLANWYEECDRNINRLYNTIDSISVGKVAGAMGTYANTDKSTEYRVCSNFGLCANTVSTQVISRDVHAEFFNTLAVIGASIERFATEIRGMQRSEIDEVQEGFSKGQGGSSAMPHKHNPIGSENLVGLARMLRGYAVAAMENVALWHERDISHSSVERIIGPDATNICGYMVDRFNNIMKSLVVNKANMKRNLESAGAKIYSEQLLLLLTGAGMSRQEAYGIVQEYTTNSIIKSYADFMHLIEVDGRVTRYINKRKLRSQMSIKYHTRNVDDIFKRVFEGYP